MSVASGTGKKVHAVEKRRRNEWGNEEKVERPPGSCILTLCIVPSNNASCRVNSMTKVAAGGESSSFSWKLARSSFACFSPLGGEKLD